MTSRLRPIQLLWFIGLSNLAITAALIVMDVYSRHLPEGQRLPTSIRMPCLTVMGISLAAGIVGEWLLQRGVRSGAWSDALLDSARHLITHPSVKFLSTAIGIFAILRFFREPVRGLSSFMLFVCLPVSLSRVSTTLKRKEPEFTSMELSNATLSTGKPLHSERWGN